MTHKKSCVEGFFMLYNIKKHPGLPGQTLPKINIIESLSLSVIIVKRASADADKGHPRIRLKVL